MPQTPATKLLVEYIESPLPFIAVFLGLVFAFGLISNGALDSVSKKGEVFSSSVTTGEEEEPQFTFCYCCYGPNMYDGVESTFNLAATVSSAFAFVATTVVSDIIITYSSDVSYFHAIEIRQSVFVLFNTYFFFLCGFWLFSIVRGCNYQPLRARLTILRLK
jgi:hypothetical protein